MLRSLHIKNMAIVREVDLSFSGGLEVFSGETGAGKSMVVNALSAVLGERVDKALFPEEEDVLIEAVFTLEKESEIKALRDMDLSPDEDGDLLIVRKIRDGKSTFRINDETVTGTKVREAAVHLADIYGQNEHRILIDPKMQLRLLDAFGGEDSDRMLDDVSFAYHEYLRCKKELEDMTMDTDERSRMMDLLRYEISEIQAASLSIGEEEELEEERKKLASKDKILTAVQKTYGRLEYLGDGILPLLGESEVELNRIASLDPSIEDMTASLRTAQDILSDVHTSLERYIDDTDHDEDRLRHITDRLDTIRHLESKYGRTIEDVLSALHDKEKTYATYESYDEHLRTKTAQYQHAMLDYEEMTKRLTRQRKKAASQFEKELTEQLMELNFPDVRFQIDLSQRSNPGENGADDTEYLISLNPGESMRPLRLVASGGELSRIMLGIKTVFANIEDVGTMIFDEVDAGISGRTAQKVAEKLQHLANVRQILCITHLPQIAAMADHQYLVDKETSDGITKTGVKKLDDNGRVLEIARMIGGTKVTEQTMAAASEMCEMANSLKETKGKL